MADINPFRYRTYYYDNETWFYYLQSRYYDPTIGRFINADDIIAKLGNVQGTNMFTYCMNNPVNMSDSSGNWPLLATFAAVAIGVAVSSAVNHIINAVNKKKIDAEIESSYSVEEATIAINDIAQKYSTDSHVEFDVPREDGLLQVVITDSYNVTSRYDRQKICSIIENTIREVEEYNYDTFSFPTFSTHATPIVGQEIVLHRNGETRKITAEEIADKSNSFRQIYALKDQKYLGGSNYVFQGLVVDVLSDAEESVYVRASFRNYAGETYDVILEYEWDSRMFYYVANIFSGDSSIKGVYLVAQN